MTDDDIIRLAREAHGELLASGKGMHVWHEDAYVGDVQAFCERFADLVAAAKEQEMLAEGWVLDFPPPKEEADE
jgi:hypothetical protein